MADIDALAKLVVAGLKGALTTPVEYPWTQQPPTVDRVAVDFASEAGEDPFALGNVYEDEYVLLVVVESPQGRDATKTTAFVATVEKIKAWVRQHRSLTGGYWQGRVGKIIYNFVERPAGGSPGRDAAIAIHYKYVNDESGGY